MRGFVRVTSCCLCAILFWHCAKANTVPIGLVLSGGGAKGAYEVGVWQELQALGLASNVTAISGTSIGAINAALFAIRPSAAETLWLENLGDVFTLNTNSVGQTLQKIIDTASESIDHAKKTGKDWKGGGHFFLSTFFQVASNAVDITQTNARSDGYIDSSRLASVLHASLPVKWPMSVPAVYVTTLEKGTWQRAIWSLNGEPHKRRILMLRASAAIPMGFDTVEIDGKTYVDGGWEAKGGDNVPLKPILENHPEIKTVIIVYLDTADDTTTKKRIDRNKAAAEKVGVNLVEITPSKPIGGWISVFDTSSESARRLIDLGRKDTREALKKARLTK